MISEDAGFYLGVVGLGIGNFLLPFLTPNENYPIPLPLLYTIFGVFTVALPLTYSCVFGLYQELEMEE